jgi:NAD+ kinase
MKALIVYKKSTYSFYKDSDINLSQNDLTKLKASDKANTNSIRSVERALEYRQIPYKSVYRADYEEAKDFDFVVAVGGDGTFIEATRCLNGQPILGVNSDTNSSYGNYCRANSDNVQNAIDSVVESKVKIEKRFRIIIKVDGVEHTFPAMNDLLITHASPAGLTRYVLNLDDAEDEEHFCSGMWISTASGSTGAIDSFGGKTQLTYDAILQFKTFGMNRNKAKNCNYVEGWIFEEKFCLTSKMREGKIFVDGQHVEIDFPFNSRLEVSSGKPISFVSNV